MRAGEVYSYKIVVVASRVLSCSMQRNQRRWAAYTLGSLAKVYSGELKLSWCLLTETRNL